MVYNPVHAEQGGECAGIGGCVVHASGRRYLVIVRIGDKVLSSRQPQGGAYIRARLHVVSAYPVIDRSPRLAVASSRRFNIIYVFGQTLYLFHAFGRRFNLIYALMPTA